MKKIVELVDLSFKNSHDYFEKSIDIQHIKEDLISTFTPSQKVMFETLLERIYKLHKLDIEEHIVHTHKVCKDIFKLR
ncbi:MAG: hypothetical protein IJX17_01170 [Clostridia bacterium]|nr:hypothetical protein [Clostridia bacterium]